ncbi:MAG: EFR1 family ferrodoxin [Clostridia bacterium]|nr:EFR1 family ferrodoxin [Clostridia bacterium]
MKYYNITFSPTGGTKKVADIVAKGIGGEWESVELCVSKTDIIPHTFSKDDICIIAVPSFGGRVPEINVERIRNLKGNGARAILLCVYGNRAYEDTLTELFDEASNAGFKCICAIGAIAEHSIARQFASGRPDADDEKDLTDFAKQISNKIKSADCNFKDEIPGNRNPYKERGKSTSKPETSQNCIGCGVCAKGCPAGAISFDNPSQTDNDKCISCMKCISVCPLGARALGDTVLNAVSDRLGKVCNDRKQNELFI